jgi:putative transposase
MLAGAAVHVIQRGHYRRATFPYDDDFARYRDTLQKAAERFAMRIHAYVFMTNHVHLLVTPDEDDSVAQVMQAIGREYVRYVNARNRRLGTLWEGRFRSSPIDSDRYLLTCSRYIELNPVRAHMVSTPAEYSWSSHCCNAYGDLDRLITPHKVYEDLAPTALERRQVYRALFDTPLEEPTLNRIRNSLARGDVLGGEDFIEQMEAKFQRRLTRRPRGRPSRKPPKLGSEHLF